MLASFVCRSYLKLYTSMRLEKLAKYMNTTVDDLETNLLCFKHKMTNVVWTKGTSALEGDFQSESEVNFYIDNEMIHIADTKVDRRYGDFFIRQIHKFEELHRSLSALKM
jgi:translation initiation factor 3 subunit L